MPALRRLCEVLRATTAGGIRLAEATGLAAVFATVFFAGLLETEDLRAGFFAADLLVPDFFVPDLLVPDFLAPDILAALFFATVLRTPFAARRVLRALLFFVAALPRGLCAALLRETTFFAAFCFPAFFFVASFLAGLRFVALPALPDFRAAAIIRSLHRFRPGANADAACCIVWPDRNLRHKLRRKSSAFQCRGQWSAIGPGQ